MNWIYVVTTIRLEEKTEKDIVKDFEINKIKYPRWKNKTIKEYQEFLKSWKMDKYLISQEDNSYFLDLKQAKYNVEENVADINDGGAYNYVVIKKIPLNVAYGTIIIEDYYIYRYNKEIRKYMEVKLDENEEVKHLVSIFN